MNKHTVLIPLIVTSCLFCTKTALSSPVTKAMIRETVELAARKSGKKAVNKTTIQAAEKTLQKSCTKFGAPALAVAKDGGFELLEATARHGDDIMKFGLKSSPAARRALALNADKLLPMARRLGPEVLEIEAKAPGLLHKVVANFGDDACKTIAAKVPAEDLPRLLAYAEKADTPHTRQVLLESYLKEGTQLLDKIPPKYLMTGALTTAAIYAVHRATSPLTAISKTIQNNPDIAASAIHHTINVTAIFIATALLISFLYYKFMSAPKKNPHDPNPALKPPTSQTHATDK